MVALRNRLSLLLLGLFDLSAFYASLVLAFYTRKFLNLIFPNLIAFEFSFTYFIRLWWVPAIYIAFLAYERLYAKRLPFWEEAKESIKAVTIAIIVIFAILSLSKMIDRISRLTVLFLWLYSLFVVPLFKLFAKKLLWKIGLWQENVIILGAGSAGIETVKGINRERHLGYNIIGFLDDADEKIGKKIKIDNREYKVFGKTKYFKKFVDFLDVSTIIIAIPSLSLKGISEMTNTVQQHTKRVLLVPDLKGISLLNTELNHLFMQQLFLLKINNNLKSSFNRLIKRSFDVMIAALCLPFFFLLMIVLGVLIKIDSPGPVFYPHMRLGQNGSSVKVYKLRTMYADAKERLEVFFKVMPSARREWEANFKLKDDPRVTKIGKFLRKTSLDELPQIFNILIGNMSLVGPRPVLREEIDKHYREYADYYFMVRPGITGLWQVSGRNDTDYDFRVKLDAWYVLNWSLWLDVVILFKTIRTVLKSEGAY